MKKDIWVVVIVLCVLGILAVIYKVWKDGKDGLLEKFFNNETIENYDNPVLNNNLISNGSFNDGKSPIQYTGSHGNAEVIVFPNNGQSSYVLRQSALKTLSPNEPIYYRLDVLLKPNSIYYLGCLYFSTRNAPLRALIIYNKTSKVYLRFQLESQYTYVKTGDFKYYYTLFKTPSDTEQIKASIYLSYNYNNITGFNYLTDIGLYELLNTGVIPVWDDLRSYFNPYNSESIEAGYGDLRDLSLHGYDFKSKLSNNVTKGNISLTDNILTGPNAFKLQNQGMINLTNNFTFLIFVKGRMVTSKKLIEGFQNANTSAAANPDPMTMSLEDFQKIWNQAGCQSILSENSVSWWRTQPYQTVINDIKNYYQKASTCSGSDNINSICLPGKCAKTGTVSSGTQSEKAMTDTLLRQPSSIITTTSSSQLENTILSYDAIQLINFPGNQGIAVSIIVPKTYGQIRIVIGGTVYETTMAVANFMDQLYALTYNGEYIILYLNGEPILETICPKIYFDNNNVMINPEAKFNGDLYAFAYYNRNLSAQQVRSVSQYFVKMRANGEEVTTISSKMINYVKTFIIGDIGYAGEEEGIAVGSNQDQKLFNDVSQNNPGFTPEQIKKKMREIQHEEEVMTQKKILESTKCPKVVFEDGHYYVIVQKDSKLAQDIGYSGLRDYGTNIDTARQIFETNFPSCPLPDVLDKKKYKGELEECPFIVLNEDNPCKVYDCQGTDWKQGTSNKPACKRAIDNYCTKYNSVDSACYCWRPENKDKTECLQWRGQFDSPDKCDFRKYPITVHPDADKWIEKDKIPCWGCNLPSANKCVK